MQHSGGRGFLPAFLDSFPLSSRQPFQQPFQPRLPRNARQLSNQRQSRTKGKFAIAVLTGCCLAAITQAAAAQLKAGVARVSINPMEEKIPAQLGGYGAREGKPAEGTLDTIYGKVILFDWGGEKSAVITVDMCSVPIRQKRRACNPVSVDTPRQRNAVPGGIVPVIRLLETSPRRIRAFRYSAGREANAN